MHFNDFNIINMIFFVKVDCALKILQERFRIRFQKVGESDSILKQLHFSSVNLFAFPLHPFIKADMFLMYFHYVQPYSPY